MKHTKHTSSTQKSSEISCGKYTIENVIMTIIIIIITKLKSGYIISSRCSHSSLLLLLLLLLIRLGGCCCCSRCQSLWYAGTVTHKHRGVHGTHPKAKLTVLSIRRALFLFSVFGLGFFCSSCIGSVQV